jgi:hypothetical protein
MHTDVGTYVCLLSAKRKALYKTTQSEPGLELLPCIIASRREWGPNGNGTIGHPVLCMRKRKGGERKKKQTCGVPGVPASFRLACAGHQVQYMFSTYIGSHTNLCTYLRSMHWDARYAAGLASLESPPGLQMYPAACKHIYAGRGRLGGQREDAGVSCAGW